MVRIASWNVGLRGLAMIRTTKLGAGRGVRCRGARLLLLCRWRRG